MNIRDILQWQWDGYNKFHKSRINLWIHILAVPVFIFGTLFFIGSLISLNILSLIYSVLLMAISIAVQGFGHSKEALPAEPFSSAKNAFLRIFLEQLYTFPKFVITGKWYSALRNSKP
ncbi:hypothetical protein PA25_32510 [Pseudoalteromonas sp. A25]|uniref:terminase n=1 Tax=Pseudoalteromonas sp. A25 TaxID=116092 RepID=UPI0012604C49|nr:terminase [Pseudoalteromonas sp. A25]BBN83266.1 hypothetical protein PA25_32510 [Pseudoalteromonas sp. A25]